MDSTYRGNFRWWEQVPIKVVPQLYFMWVNRCQLCLLRFAFQISNKKYWQPNLVFPLRPCFQPGIISIMKYRMLLSLSLLSLPPCAALPRMEGRTIAPTKGSCWLLIVLVNNESNSCMVISMRSGLVVLVHNFSADEAGSFSRKQEGR